MEIHERLATLEANDKTIFHQLDEMKAEVHDIHKLATSVELIAKQTVDINKKVDNIDKRLDKVERAPNEDFRYYKRVAISCFVTGIISAILGAVLALILK